jgi:dihydropyrimidinase
VFDLLISAGTVVAPDGGLVPLDVAVHDGRIAALGRDLPGPARRTVSAEGCVILPGVIDLHTHLRSPRGEPDLFTGETSSAVAGGVTTVGDFAYPPGTRFELEYDPKRDRLSAEAVCDFLLHTVARTPEQVDSARTRTVKVFLAASGLGAQAGGGLELVRRALAKGHQVLVHVEAMDDYLAIARHVAETAGAGRAHILHVPHQRFVSAVCAAGLERLTLETCPHYLLWEWTRGRVGCDVNPAVVPSHLWPEVQAGRIQTLGTDHCSYTRADKAEFGLPGFPGLETLLRFTFTCGVQAGRISWADLCRLLSAGPARALDLYPRKGAVQVGSDADLVLFSPDGQDVVGAPARGRGDFSPFAGLRLDGKVVRTFVRGRQVYSDGAVDAAAAGWGRYVDPWLI